MGDFVLREPELGESLPRPRRPHLLPPEELALGEPEVPAPRTRPRPEDTLRAHAGDVEEHGGEHGGEHHGPHAHLEGGIEVGRDGVEGRVGGGVEIPIGDNVGVEVEGGVEGLGGDHVTGDVGGEVRIGPEDGVHGTVGVEGEHLGSEHPVVMGSAGIGFGETGSLTLSGGAELGEHPSGRLDLGGRLRVAPGLALTGHGGVEGLGGEHVSGSVGGGVELDLNDRLSIMGGVEAGGLGTDETDVRGTAGVRLRF